MNTSHFKSLVTVTVLFVLGSSILHARESGLLNTAADKASRQATASLKLEKEKSLTFEKKNSSKDLLRGFVTYSRPSNGSRRGYMALVCIRWGDLDNKIPNISSDHYSNWDGHIKVQGGGRASVVKEFAFDDGTPAGGATKGGGLGQDSGRRPPPSGSREPGQGSGRDELIKDQTSSMVAWKSGVVGATDGILVKIDLQKPDAKGTIKVGNFSIPYEIKPGPDSKDGKGNSSRKTLGAPMSKSLR